MSQLFGPFSDFYLCHCFSKKQTVAESDYSTISSTESEEFEKCE